MLPNTVTGAASLINTELVNAVALPMVVTMVLASVSKFAPLVPTLPTDMMFNVSAVNKPVFKVWVIVPLPVATR